MLGAQNGAVVWQYRGLGLSTLPTTSQLSVTRCPVLTPPWNVMPEGSRTLPSRSIPCQYWYWSP